MPFGKTLETVPSESNLIERMLQEHQMRFAMWLFIHQGNIKKGCKNWKKILESDSKSEKNEVWMYENRPNCFSNISKWKEVKNYINKNIKYFGKIVGSDDYVNFYLGKSYSKILDRCDEEEERKVMEILLGEPLRQEGERGFPWRDYPIKKVSRQILDRSLDTFTEKARRVVEPDHPVAIWGSLMQRARMREAQVLVHYMP